MNCQWEDIPNSVDERGWRRTRCARCGHETAPWPFGQNHYRQCNKPGIGDYVAAGLRMLGFKKKCAPCQKRQAALNDLGKKIGL